ncbi:MULTISPECIES: ABC transporter ATP-binding protein [unclassified Curtobacterium]|uniref:ABC transporter ATP-binding protein n=1 Tax=unclassified Curtobacterium TaxID=257496 RepID=UPI000DA9D6D0|nr:MULTISPECIES: ABC transporter ATP-binding protein [unclassified Curtobacterium]PZE25636.1 ABC transporter ATP-binding protein [Curtobacterium sp. MCBD17_028]PZE78495.1 ABC transporter ATP-binding protein [Curtobacterium sp. MCBD17_019]WIE55347.1 ABC transporter ATP-binding protein [Curtobacterium sp. MCBD17_003]
MSTTTDATAGGTATRADGAAPVLQIEGLRVSYGRGARRQQVIHDADLTIAPGEVVGLIGETGSGKSTLARAVLGLVPASGGRIILDGQDVTRASAKQRQGLRRSGRVQYVFQDPMRSLDPGFTLEQSIAEPLVTSGRYDRTTIAATVREYLAKVRLDERLLDRLPGQVSGGQRQRIAIARALVTRPGLLILDEPVSALDSANRVQILELLQGLAGPDVSLLFISHDLGSVAGITDRVVVLYRGRVVETNTTDAIINDPQHPYTQLLVGSAPTLGTEAATRAWRDELRARVDAG